MRKWALLKINTIAILGVLHIGFPSLAGELSLQQVIEAVNFTKMSIEAAELRANLYISPRPQPKSLQQKLEADIQQIKDRYQNTSNPVEKQTLSKLIKTAEDMLNAPPLPRYYEYTVIFRRNKMNNDSGVIERLGSLYSYRIFRVNRVAKHANPQFLKSIPQSVRSMYTGQEIQTEINNGESVTILEVNNRLDNKAYFEEPSAAILTVLFHGASVVFPVNLERVIDFQLIAQNGTTLYSIECAHENPALALVGVDKINSTRIQVNPSKGFAVTKMENFLHIGEKKVLNTATQFYDFKLYSQAIWYPTSIRITKYKEGRKVSEYLFDIHEADFNISIPHDFFQVQENEIRRLGIEIRETFTN